MERLNYHHLRYFWVVARHGSITRASRALHLSHPTISAQIHRFEDVLGKRLFVRRGRNLMLTEFGRVALRYADEIFTIGREFLETANGRASLRADRLIVGVQECLAKMIVLRLLQPAFHMQNAVRVIAREGRSIEAFVDDLGSRTLDLVLADSPASTATPIPLFSHLLGDCGTVFLAAPNLLTISSGAFPRCLEDLPFLMPSAGSALSRALVDWFDSLDLRPTLVADLDDFALIQVMSEAGLGVFAAPDIIETQILRRYGVKVLGRTQDLRQHFYGVTLDRTLQHPAVRTICHGARRALLS